MAQRTEIVFTDDLDGGPADETVRFGVDGASYEIDLSTAHAAEFRGALAPYVAAARKAGGRARGPARGSGAAGPSPSAVREWARAEGIEVSGRGRVPAELIVRFQAAHV
jgi:hypothetical protein